MHSTAELRELTYLASTWAREAGEEILRMREAGVDVTETKSSGTDVVTAADASSEWLLNKRIRAARPDDGILGEEGSDHEGTSGITWVLDPIDGTVNYLFNLPAYAVSVAATVIDDAHYDYGRRTIAAAVYNPVTGELFDAFAGGGAQLNGKPIGVRETTELKDSLIATGFGYRAERRREQAAIVAELLPVVADIRRFGSAAYDLCMLAAGRFDGFYERGLQPWDYAGAGLIVREAGAEVLGLPGELPGEDLLISAHAPLAHELQNFVAEHWPLPR